MISPPRFLRRYTRALRSAVISRHAARTRERDAPRYAARYAGFATADTIDAKMMPMPDARDGVSPRYDADACHVSPRHFVTRLSRCRAIAIIDFRQEVFRVLLTRVLMRADLRARRAPSAL